MSESDTMFNEQDRRCAAVQLMLSTDPSYDSRIIANTLKMQIWIATNNRDVPRVMKTKFMVFGVVSSEGHIVLPHIFEVSLKVNTKVYLYVLKSVVVPLVQSVGQWQTLGVAAGLGTGPQVQRDSAWLEKECYHFVPFSDCPLPPQTWTRWTTSFGHTSRTSLTWPPTTPKPAWWSPSAEYSPISRQRLWKRHAPSSGSVSWRWLRLKAATLNIC